MNRHIHLALRFNSEWWPTPTLKVNTIQTHQDVINQHGNVWWGKFGRGISTNKFQKIKYQIDQGIPTFAYLFENSPFNGAYTAQILGIENDYFDTQQELIPSYYRRESKGYDLFLNFNLFSKANRDNLIDNLILLSNPIKGSLENSFKGASSLFYVDNLSINKFLDTKMNLK